MKRVLFQPAYVLHRRAYRESSFLIDLFTIDYGRVTVIAKGVRKARSALPALLQPFASLSVSWSGNGDLVILNDAEIQGEVKPLMGECLFAGFYLNELIIGLLQKWDAHPGLYKAYETTLTALQTGVLAQKSLRQFEKSLLVELGYGIFPAATVAQELFAAEQYYRFVAELGWQPIKVNDSSDMPSNAFSGRSLIAIATENWEDDSVLQDAKRLMRLILTPLLGQRQIHSRKLFIKRETYES